jgi:hypothetical protein
MRPLALDIAAFLLPIAFGVLLFLVGRGFRKWPLALRVLLLVVSLTAIAAGVLSGFHVLPVVVERNIQLAVGMTPLLCLVACFLLGVVRGVPGRSLTTPFLFALAGLALVIIAIESSGRLWWRFVSPGAWERTPNEAGLLQQSSGMSCSPTAAVMLLHRFGISSSEGEMAYLAGTTLLGTDAFNMARALDTKAQTHGLRAVAETTTYDAAVARGEPFLAHVKGGVLGHAVTVVQMTPEGVIILDPATGQPYAITRQVFEAEWDGVGVRLVR